MKLTEIKALAERVTRADYDYDSIGIRIQDAVYDAQTGSVLDHESRNFGGDFGCGQEDGERLGGVSAIDATTAKYLSDYGSYQGNVALILGSNSASSGYDPEELIMETPVVIDVIKI